MESIYIRKLDTKDWPLFRSMRIEMVTHNPECFLESAEQAKSRPDERWITGLSNQKNALFTLFDGDTPIGFAGSFHYGDMKENERDIGMLYVNPYNRGKGLALQLVSHCIDHAIANKSSISHMKIGHRRNNMASKSVILRSGFIPIGEQRYIFGNGEEDISIKYEKII